MWSTFTETLAQLYAQYEKIRAVQERKRGLLVALDMEGLEKLVAEEDFLARAVEQLEKAHLRLGVLHHVALEEASCPRPVLPPDLQLDPHR